MNNDGSNDLHFNDDLKSHLDKIESQSHAVSTQLNEVRESILKIDITGGISDPVTIQKLNEKQQILLDGLSKATKIANSLQMQVKAQKILKCVVGLEKKPSNISQYDLNFDGKITAEDALEALKQANDIY